MGTTLIALGHYAPERRVTNPEIESRLGLAAGWIERRTGIVERRYAAADEALSDMALKAGEMALARAGLARESIGLLVLATSTPDHLLPPTAPLVAHQLGLKGAGAIDMAGACGGFMYALAFADGFVKLQGRPALVIAANILSRRTNLDDRASSVLFADAAGAALLAPSSRESGVVGLDLTSDGSQYDLIGIPAGGTRTPFSAELDPTAVLMEIRDGKAVFTKVSRLMVESAKRALARAGARIEDVRHFIPHQANQRIIDVVQKELGLADDVVLSSVSHFGNSSAATIPFTFSLRAAERDVRAGDLVLMCGAGAGLTGGSVVFRM